MTLKRQLRDTWPAAKWGVILATFAGVVILLMRTPLERWSYDLPHWLRPQVTITNVAIIYMDDATHAVHEQPLDAAWDRKLHAQLVDILTKAGAKAIIFDITFSATDTNGAGTEALARAIRSHGQVVLAADLGSGDYYGLASDIKLFLPQTNLLAATPHWGFSQLHLDPDDAVRQHFHGWEGVPSLSWKAASVLGLPVTKEPNGQRQERWLNYYGPHRTIPGLSYNQALENSPSDQKFFRDRVVFIGSLTASGFSGKRRDQFRTPFSGRSESLWPGVEFHATQFLNLMRGDWLRRMNPFAEIGLVLVCGVLSGFGLALLRPWMAAGSAFAAAILVGLAASFLVWEANTWFAWLVLAAVQLPIALTCAIVQKAESEILLAPGDRTTDFSAGKANRRLVIPDYEMMRRIGSGSYGEVWIARSATGTLRAVKIVDRKSAQDPRFEREFAGLKKFEPISRAHEGLVDILHIGRNEAAGVLYYVMELADTCAMVTGEDAEGYVPSTLKTKIQSDASFDADQIVKLSIALTSALAFLHEQGLMHRDIKPSNIIFVQAKPKLADIGLVAATDETHSFVGTEGYIPPEGPGTTAADVFSLGKVLSELLAHGSLRGVSNKKLSQVHRVVERACARNVAERYATAGEMLGDLVA